MTQIAYLPTLTVEVAFNPTALLSNTQTWTDVTNYVRSISTHGGRQHYLARIEASTLNVTLDNRTGFFMNGSVNGTGQIIGTRLPIRVKATWSSTTYSIFTGIIDVIETRIQDALNSDLTVTATDKLKYLSLRYLNNPNLYAQLAEVSSTRSWYNSAQGNSLPDNVGAYNGYVYGTYTMTEGVLLYDRTQAIDVTGGTQETNTADLRIPIATAGALALDNGIEFWIIGQALNAVTLVPINLYGGFSLTDISISVNNDGVVTTANGLTSTTVINDGRWHHVALILDSATAKMTLIVDGAAVAGATTYIGGYGFLSNGTDTNNYQIANSALCYVDQIVISDSTVITSDVQNRYAAGSLLRLDQNTADRIAAALVIGGQGSIVAGAVTPDSFYVDGPASPYVPGASGNGVAVQGSSTPVTDTTTLDVIQTASDTDQGSFFQADDGTFQYETRAYIYRAAANAAPTGGYVWTDDDAYAGAAHYDAGSFQITRDDADVWTSVIVSPQNGTPQTYETTANISRWGQSTLTVSTAVTSLEQAYQQAVYLANTFATPLARVGSVMLLSETNGGADLTTMLSTNLNDRIRILRHPINASAAGTTDTDMLIESINHEFEADPGFWHTNYVLDPYPIRYSTQASPNYFLIADDATYGLADQGRAL
jgi:hypothetical protein